MPCAVCYTGVRCRGLRDDGRDRLSGRPDRVGGDVPHVGHLTRRLSFAQDARLGFPTDPTSSGSFTRSDLGRSDADEHQATLSGRLKEAGFVQGAEITWHKRIKASSSVMLFETASGAHEAMSAFGDFSRRYQSEVEHEEVTDTPVEALGQEAWGIQQQDDVGNGDADSVT
jgi:hypothetical protein